MSKDKAFFVLMEYKKGVFTNASTEHEDIGVLSSDELMDLENRFVQTEGFERDICKIVNHKPFMQRFEGEGIYICHFLIDGTGSFKHIDFSYSGAIESLEDIAFIEQMIAKDIGVNEVVVGNFALIEKEEFKEQED